jgi:predicted nucleotidyltransferase
MDKNAAIKISIAYLKKVRDCNIEFSQAWLFGSFAKGNNHEYSDIDLAIVLTNNSKTFDTEVKLMSLRTGEEIIIEPHPFNKDDFALDSPLVFQIMNTGLKIEA